MLNINRTSFCFQHWRRCWTLWCNVLWETNKWLIRDFPEDLGIKQAILFTQISLLFNSELRTPSLVYAIFEWFSHWSKFEALPHGMLRLGRYAMSAVDKIITVLVAVVDGLSPQTKSNVNDLFFSQH